MELLAYIQEDFAHQEVIADAIAPDSDNNHNSPKSPNYLEQTLSTWFKEVITRSAKLSLNVILAGTSLFIGLGSTLSTLAAPSEDIRYIQTLLANKGFNPGEIDGIDGASTRAAIADAQKALGLTVDGIAGAQTIAALDGRMSVATANASIATETSPRSTVTNTSNLTGSSTVMNLQKLLADRGFYKGAVDGIMGTQTREAILAAQKAYNLTPDGIAGPRTIAALEADAATAVPPTANANTKSDDVLKLQELLNKRGFYSGDIDGIMGPQTRLAIVAAQKAYNLTPDGIAGTKTLAALNAGAATTPPDPQATSGTGTSGIAVVVSQDTKDLQTLLARRGFYNGAIDGIKGSQTTAAILAAQKAYGLTTDGIAGVQTIAALEKDARVSPPAAANPPAAEAPPASNSDRNIANLQNLLTDRGFYDGAITGVAGPKTTAAIIAAQKAYGLTADGIAGPQTIAALEAGTPAPVKPAPSPAPAPIPSNIPPTSQPSVNTPVIRVETKPQVNPPASPSVSNVQPQVQPVPVVTPAPTKPVVAAANPPATSADSNPQIIELQNLLTKRGFYNGKPDGVLNDETRNAITRAQNFYTISPADGSPSSKLVENLSKDTFLSEGN
ncbi:MAG: peptidoglycan-binding protein [Pseudanabaenaceae cyanobacterium bins.39]|nr:peptidoglycan-binding protein [Pseudanabaenaceae cyanobacterium bins.39]